MDERDGLLREQRDAQKERDDAVKELKAIQGRGERLPQDLKDKAAAANQRIIDLGTKVANLDADRERLASEDSEFFNGLDARAAEEVLETLETRDEGDLEDPNRRDATINRDSLAALSDSLSRILGTRQDHPGVRRTIPESEALVRDMISGHPSQDAQNMGGWNRRRNDIAKRHKRWYGEQEPQARVNVIGSDYTQSSGGILVPDDNSFMSQVQLAGAAYGGVKRVARTFVTSDGRPLPIPTSYSANTTGARTNENTQIGDFDLVFGEETMDSYMATSGRLGMSFQLMRDAAPNMPMLLGLVAGVRIERREADWFINGDGTSGLAGNPRGLDSAYQVQVPGPTDGNVGYDISLQRFVNPGTENEFDRWWEFLTDIRYAVNPFYRSSQKYSLVLADFLDKGFVGATDNDGNPLRGLERWSRGNTSKGMGVSDFGMNILSDYSISGPPTAASAMPSVDRRGWVGDFNWFWIRRVRGMYMIRDPYTSARQMLTHWIFARACDSEGLFRTEDSAALTNANPDGGGFAAVKCITIDAQQ